MGLGKFIINGVVTTAIAATAEVAAEKSRNEREIAREKEVTERMRLKNEKAAMKQEAAAQKLALKNEREIAMQQAANQRAMLEDQARARHMRQLDEIRAARAANPISLSCPRCLGVREYNRKRGVVTCPYCDFVETMHPAHVWNDEIDGTPQQGRYFPAAPPAPYDPRPNSTIKGFVNKFFK